mgnify:FL=1
MDNEVHIFKKSDGSWIFSGSMVPSNLATDEYAFVYLEEGEVLDHGYVHTYVDGNVVKGAKIEWSDPPE